VTNYLIGNANVAKKQKKADVAKHPEVLHHVGLLIDEPPRYWVALHLVVRRHNQQSRELRNNFALWTVPYRARNAIPHPNGAWVQGACQGL